MGPKASFIGGFHSSSAVTMDFSMEDFQEPKTKYTITASYTTLCQMPKALDIIFN